MRYTSPGTGSLPCCFKSVLKVTRYITSAPAPCHAFYRVIRPSDEGIRCPNLGKPAWSLEPWHWTPKCWIQIPATQCCITLIMCYSNLFNIFNIHQATRPNRATTCHSFDPFSHFLPVYSFNGPSATKWPPAMRSQTGRREWTKRPARSAWPPVTRSDTFRHVPTLSDTELTYLHNLVTISSQSLHIIGIYLCHLTLTWRSWVPLSSVEPKKRDTGWQRMTKDDTGYANVGKPFATTICTPSTFGKSF